MLCGKEPKAVVRDSHLTFGDCVSVETASASQAEATLPSIAAFVSASSEPPSSACSSHKMTRAPWASAASAAAMPAGPAPMMSASQWA